MNGSRTEKGMLKDIEGHALNKETIPSEVCLE